jgi:hypothetical protein
MSLQHLVGVVLALAMSGSCDVARKACPCAVNARVASAVLQGMQGTKQR